MADDKIDNEELTKIAKEAKATALDWKEFGTAVMALFRKSTA